MKVKELIEKLKELDQDLNIYIPYDSFSEGIVEEMSIISIMEEPDKPNEDCKGVWLW
jgi:hypothetical protein